MGKMDKDKRGFYLSPDQVADLKRKLAKINEQCEFLKWKLMFQGFPEIGQKPSN